MRYSLNKIIWSMDEVGSLLAGSETMAALLRNSRHIMVSDTSASTGNQILERVYAWITDNTTSLCVVDRMSGKNHARVLFEDKADLAKFLLAFAGGSLDLVPTDNRI